MLLIAFFALLAVTLFLALNLGAGLGSEEGMRTAFLVLLGGLVIATMGVGWMAFS